MVHTLVHQLSNLRTTMVVRKMVGVRGVFNSAWSGLVYYWTPERALMRLSLMTLEQQEVYREEDPEAPLVGSSVSPDQRHIVGMAPRLAGPGAPVFQIIRLDITTGKRDVILEHPEICNPHLQFLTRGLKVAQCELIGRKDLSHLKMLFEAGKTRWPGMYWNAASRYPGDFAVGDTVNVAARIESTTKPAGWYILLSEATAAGCPDFAILKGGTSPIRQVQDGWAPRGLMGRMLSSFAPAF